MTRATPTAKSSAIGVGMVGLAAIGAVAGAVPAHADASGGAVNASPMIALKGLLSGDATRGLGLYQLPVVGAVPGMLTDMPVSVVPQVVPAMLKGPAARMRPVPAAPAAGGASGDLSSLTSGLPLGGLGGASGGLGLLPLASNLPLDTDKTGELLQQLTGGSGLSGLGPVGSLTSGLGGVAAL